MEIDIKEVIVNAGESRYKVYIGNMILQSILERIDSGKYDKVVLIISKRVFALHKDYIEDSFKNFNYIEILIMDDSEENKNYTYAGEFLNRLVDIGLSRHSVVIDIGGGVVGDFSGYLASLYMRGISFIHIPTTLLSMVDSSVGGKVAVNLTKGKNIAGAFHQPDAVICDVHFLTTLSEDEFKNGLSEIIKHGFIGDKSTIEMFHENDFNSIKKNSVIIELIYLSVVFKAGVVEEDEKENGRRAILNFGHTIGHAVESFYEYKISHGEAIAFGIKVALEISFLFNWISEDELKKQLNLMKVYSLGEKKIKADSKDLIEHMKYDKKNSKGKINFVILKNIFNPVFNIEVEKELLAKALNKYLI